MGHSVTKLREVDTSVHCLDIETHGIASVEVGDTDLVFAGRLVREGSDDLLNLCREYVDALDFHHVIGTTFDDVDEGVGAAAGAFARNDTGKVMRTVTDERCAFFHESRDDDFAPLAVREDLAGLRINDLEVDVVIPDMHVLGLGAVDADARSVDLSQSVDIIELDSEDALNSVAHCLAPALGTDDAFLEMNLVFDSALLDFLRQKKSVGGSGAEDGGLHVHHHLKLLLGIAGTHRNDHSAEFFGTVLETDTGSPETVAGCDVNAVLIGDAGGLIAALEHLAPVVNVFCSVRNDDRKACGA